MNRRRRLEIPMNAVWVVCVHALNGAICGVCVWMQYFAEGRDLEYLNEQTKVVWACSPPLFLFKPRDYCTIVHYRKESDGTIIGTSDVSHLIGLISAAAST